MGRKNTKEVLLMSKVAFLWIFSRGMELGVIVLCLLPLRALLRRKVPRLFSYMLWAALPLNLVYNLCMWFLPKQRQWIADYMHRMPQVTVKEDVVQGMMNIWMVGTVCVVSALIVSYVCFLHRLVGSIRLQKGIYVAERIQTPFTLGLLYPKIYLPLTLDKEYYESVILHERVHIGRKDIWMKYLAVVFLGLFWFQPALWFVYPLFVNDMEEACDETVLRQKGPEFREEYARALLEVSFQAGAVKGAALGYGNGAIKSRIVNIMNYKQSGRKTRMVAVGLCVAFLIVSIPVSWQVPRLVRAERQRKVNVNGTTIQERGAEQEQRIRIED